jgi:hypothetical protein
MGLAEYLEQVRSEVEGDAFFRLLKSHLAAGNRVQKVSFVPSEGKQPPRYRFLLARLGTLTTVDVPAGELAVERLLAETRQKLASREDEVRRCELRLHRTMEAVAQVLGRAHAREALLRVSRLMGGPQAAQAVAKAPPHTNESSTTRLALRHLRQEIDALLLDLFAERGYSLDEAGGIMDEALARLIGAD